MRPPHDSGRNLGLDLIRSAAIGLVLISHWGDTVANFYGGRPPAWLSQSGLFGVELFFVLSGFLIGGLLLEIVSRGASWPAWRVFMVRRWMRTVPLYALWLGFMAVFWRPGGHYWRHVAGYSLFLQNWAWPMPQDNWFGVSWSLTIEEWFYLLFSTLLIGGAMRWGTRRGVAFALAAFLAVPLAARWGLTVFVPAGVEYKVALLRLDAIAYGVALAKLRADGSALFGRPRMAAVIGVVLVGLMWVRLSSEVVPIPQGLFQALFLPAVDLGFCLCVAGAVSLREGIGVVAAGIGWLSRISYGLYIMHLTILEMVSWGVAQGRFSAPAGIALMIVVPLVLASLSFQYFETPILKRRPKQVYGGAAVLGHAPWFSASRASAISAERRRRYPARP